MVRHNTYYIIGQAISLAIIVGAMMLWRGAPVVGSTIALAALWSIVCACYYRCRWRSSMGWWTLLAAFTLLAIGYALNINYFTTASGGNLDAPVLNNIDAKRTWVAALYELRLPGGEYLNSMRGYGLFVSALMKVFGLNIAVPIIANIAAVMFTIILTGAIAHKATDNRRIAGVAMVMIASVCYFLASGVILLKDAMVCLSMALAFYGLISLRRISIGRYPIGGLLALVAAASGLYLIRANYLPFMALAAIVMLPWRINRRAFVATLLVVAGLIVVWRISYLVGGFVSTPSKVIAGGEDSAMVVIAPQHIAYAEILGDYTSLSWWQKLLRLPLTAAVQYMVPFPWSFGRDMVFGPSLAYAHVAYPWYAVGACIIYYFIFCVGRSDVKVRATLTQMACAAVLCYICTAYLSAGMASRYYLPLLPALLPAAAYVVVNHWRCRAFKIYAVVYALLIAAVLIVAYNMQMSAL